LFIDEMKHLVLERTVKCVNWIGDDVLLDMIVEAELRCPMSFGCLT
jgi:hypothetical protein